MHDWIGYVRGKLPPLNAGPQRESAIIAELALQMEQTYNDAISAGEPEAVALRRARAQFADWQGLAGDINSVERRALSANRATLLAGFLRDLRYASRSLMRSPGFAAVAIATLAFGIGANTAIFTLVDAVAIRSVPYYQANRLVAVETRKAQQPELEPWTSTLDFADLRQHATSFATLAGVSPIWNVVMTGRGETERVESLYVSADFFPTLGVGAQVGRTFTAEEDIRARPAAVVVLSHALWSRRFGADAAILGQAITFDSQSYRVIGVLPGDFRYAGEPVAGTASEIDAWFPLAANPIVNSARSLRFLKVVGRLKPGISIAQCADEVRRIGNNVSSENPATNRGFVMDAKGFSAQVTGRFRLAMLLLLGTVGFVLLMACANVANLLMARASARQREISIRAALGASRLRLFQQMLAEGAVLAVAGGVSGIGLAYFALRFLVAVAPTSLVHPGSVALDGRALAFTTFAVVIATLLASLPTGWRVARDQIECGLRSSGRSFTGGGNRLRSALVVVQIAAALVLMVGAGLLIRSFQRVLAVDPGFRPANLLTVSTQLPSGTQSPAQRTALLRTIRESLQAMPGVESVAAISRLPLLGSNLSTWLFPEGKFLPGEPGHDVEYRAATINYFTTMGIPLKAGKLFDDRDIATPDANILVNETAARKFWPGENPVGKRVKLGTRPERHPWITVIGIVGDVRHSGIDAEPRPEVYRPDVLSPLGAPILVVRTVSDPGLLAPSITARIRSVAAGMPTYNVFSMQALVDRSTAQRRFVMLLLTGFAAAALILAGVGVYGTVSQSVVQRTQEIGLRMALGASPGSALRLVLGQGVRLTAAGLMAGSVGAFGLARGMRSMLFAIGPMDAVAYLEAALLLAVFAGLACYFPARRATRVDPLVALRSNS